MTDTSTAGGMPPPGWYDDPAGAPQLRWWGGLAWTEHVKDNAPVAVLEQAAPVVVAPVVYDFKPYVDVSRSAIHDEPEPPGSTSGLPTWLLALLPFAGLLVNVVVVYNLERLDIIIAAFVAYTVGAFLLAVWDRAVLRRHGIPGPSLWWYLLAFPFSYLISRWVILSRRGLPGQAPAVTYFASSFAAGALAAVFAASVGLSPMGPIVVHGLENQFEAQLQKETSTVWDVDCPDTAHVWEVGATFECTFTGQVAMTVTGHVVKPFEFEFDEPVQKAPTT